MLHDKRCSIVQLKWTMVVLLLMTMNNVYAAHDADRGNEIIPILKQSQNGPNPEGTYSWSYETGNSIKADEQTVVIDGSAHDNIAHPTAVRGSYSYIGTDGTPFHVTYTADENGFHPTGAHFPNPPQIPPAILKALQWIADHPEEDNLRK